MKTKKKFYTKRFYTVAELTYLFYNAHRSFELYNEASKKFPDDKLVQYNLNHAKDMLNELYYLLEKNEVLGIILDYYGGFDLTTGNDKIYLK